MSKPLDTLRAEIESRRALCDRNWEGFTDSEDLIGMARAEARVQTYDMVLDMIGRISANVAQSEEQAFCEREVVGSTPTVGSQGSVERCPPDCHCFARTDDIHDPTPISTLIDIAAGLADEDKRVLVRLALRLKASIAKGG